jgi:hypothetical protein
MRTATRPAHWAALGLALALFASFSLVWLGLGLGIIGADGARINVIYGAVLLVGAAGAALARLRPGGMARTLVAMAVTQAVIAVTAVLAGWGMPWSPPAEVLGLNAGFVALFLGSAWLFRRGARAGGQPASAGPRLETGGAGSVR